MSSESPSLFERKERGCRTVTEAGLFEDWKAWNAGGFESELQRNFDTRIV